MQRIKLKRFSVRFNLIQFVRLIVSQYGALTSSKINVKTMSNLSSLYKKPA